MPIEKAKSMWKTYVFTIYLKNCPRPVVVVSSDGEIHASIPGYLSIIDADYNERMFNSNEVVVIYKDLKQGD